ncbi:myotubularin-related protein 10-B [Bombus vosnesenskii]|uniref:Myotubularin-related protein 10-B n=2 Tax=Pyrobombus TaxID=144703 RepID=A0A6J3LGR4_9HYME|nr:myotubularin-related protein 10-B [Bombus vancouverensis nearcticus]XP_033316011.1 myotubularin-related protein 10-B [Bombus bifarius]XP_033364748.1 myotubularin-related protein 10-B [Bombus vosnesenskii]XP_050493147.1 myotubularin-related protein 10-B [Bombus huntii]
MESKSCNNFISYVGLEEHEMQPLGSSRRNSVSENNIKLLPGEIFITKAQNVLMFSPVSDLNQGTSGILSVTNFKLTFVTTDETNGDDVARQQNHLYGYMDTCLTNIEDIYVTVGDKKRKLIPGNIVPSKVKGIFIICKNLRTWSFSFKFSPIGDGKNLLQALLHHAFPSRHQLLFGYDYQEAYYSSLDKAVRLFRDISDWHNELERTIHNEKLRKFWRLSTVNIDFKLCRSLSRYIIIPASITDGQLIDAAKRFQGNRPPIWSWSNARGAALVKMSELSPLVTNRIQENIMFENVRKSHPQKMPPIVLELNKGISVKLIALAFSKFVSLCSPENIRQFWLQDNNFYSLVENTKWLKHVSYCLQKAVEACEHLHLGFSVILQEGAGTDLCCIVSSLVQLLLDPYFRTINGFQSLLQKEWVAGGHPFCDRLGHISKRTSEKSPLLLLYLDCVWQLSQQFPAEFEFTETYLTTLWDAAHVSIFDTFIFNCEKDRVAAATDPEKPLVLRSVWDWREQFSDQDILLFDNPLYNPRETDSKEKCVIKPLYNVANLELWTQCYFRWIPTLEIHNGGRNHIELYARLLRNDVNQLKMNINGNCGSPTGKSNSYSVQMNIDSFYPFSNKKSGNIVSTPIMNSSILATKSLLEAQSLITATD